MKAIKESIKSIYVIELSLVGLWFYNLRNLLFPFNYQQDDVSELRVSYYENLLCAVNGFGDNHPLWSALIWIFSKIVPSFENLISIINIAFVLIAIGVFYKILEDSFSKASGVFGVSLVVISPILLVYSSSLKQYPVEFLCSVVFLRIYQIEKLETKEQISDFYIVLLGGLFIAFSLVNIISVGITAVLIFLTRNKLIQNRNFSILIIFLFPILFSKSILEKVDNLNTYSYWSRFYIDTLSFEKFIDSFIFLNSLLLKSVYGVAYNQFILGLFLFGILFALISKKDISRVSVIYIFSLYILSSLNIYPLGGGRTDIIYLPFLIIVFCNLFFEVQKLFSDKSELFICFTILVLTFIFSISILNVEYKTENIELAVFEVNKDTDINKTIIVSSDQAPGYIYYSRDYSDVEIEDRGGCLTRYPKIKGFYSYATDIEAWVITGSVINLENISTSNNVWVIGIELPGTKGRFRDVEEYLIANKYVLKQSQIVPNYIYISNYKK